MKSIPLTAIALTAAFAFPAPGLAQQAPSNLQKRVEILERQVRAMTDLVLRMDTLTREMQQLRGEVEVQSHAMDALKERQRDLYLDLDKRLNDLQKTGVSIPQSSTGAATGTGPASSISTQGNVPLVNMPDLPPGDPAEENDRYREAFNMLREGNYAEAANALRAFLVQYPDSERADNAQYWLGEAGYVSRNFDQSLADFTQLLERFPNSSKTADARLKVGYIHYESKRFPLAREMLQTVLREHDGTTAARLAQQQIDRMDREGR